MTKTKKIFGFCDKCNKKLLVPSWKLCADCDFQSYRNTYLRKQVRLLKQQFNQDIKKYTTRKEAYKKASCLVIDDTGKIIGYKL